MARQRVRAGRPARLEVWKFGGASLADAAAVRNAVALIRAHRGPLVVVVSALAGVTDLLLEGARRSVAGEPEAASAAAAQFLRRHRDLAHALVPDGTRRRRLLAQADEQAREYREIAHAMAALGDLSTRASDTLVARGERAASAVVAAALAGDGRRAERIDAVSIVATDGRHGQAAPDLAETRRRARRALLPLLRRGVVPVVPGFIGAGPDGSLTTLGRGGSDLTATLLARALGATRVVLWKDVPGILTADPRAVPDARLLPQMHHREAAEVAYFGAKVLHPRALIPLDDSRIALHVRSFLDPSRPGTEVSSRRTLLDYPVKALATIRNQALVTVAGRGLMGVPGMAARTFASVHAAGVSVSTIFQSSSESSIGFTLPDAESQRAVSALRQAFAREIEAGLVEGIAARRAVAVVAVVGGGMAGTPGIAARVFSSLAAHRVNVIAIAQGSSELNISFVVDETQAAEAARAVHGAFQLSKIGGGRAYDRAVTDVVLLGFGRVGRALAEMAAASGRGRIRIVAALDRSGYVFDPRGLSRARVLAPRGRQGRRRAAQGPGRQGRQRRRGHALDRRTRGLAARARRRHGRGDGRPARGGARPGLRPRAREQEAARRLSRGARPPARGPRRLGPAPEVRGDRRRGAAGARHLPQARRQRRPRAAHRGLRQRHPRLRALGGRGRQGFSEAVKEAVALGYAEPDPREDLSGQDVLRKGLILARLLGYAAAVPSAESLVPAALRRLPLARFLEKLPAFDASWQERVAREKAHGRVLRYVVVATARSVQAGLRAVPRDSSLGALQGTRNLLSFTTRRYRREPLVVAGPGAGPEVTAAGVLNDIQSLATD